MDLVTHQLKRAAGCLADHPAFILGNGPTLPCDSLHLLDEHFTVGVNRIVVPPADYDPTILIWLDRDVWTPRKTNPAIGPHLKGKRTRMVVWEERAPSHGVWGLTVHHDGPQLSEHPGELHTYGSSGAAAACWAVSLGCRPIVLLGMGGAPVGGLTDFWGVNSQHKPYTMERFVRNLQFLRNVLGSDLIEIETADELAALMTIMSPGQGRDHYITTIDRAARRRM